MCADNSHIKTHSDILTPLPALGVPFEIDDNKGPILDNTIRTKEQVREEWVAIQGGVIGTVLRHLPKHPPHSSSNCIRWI